VEARPSADTATLLDTGVLSAVVHEPSVFRFQACDVDGLRLAHAVGMYNATCADGCSASVSYVGSGQYAVHVTLSKMDEYTVTLVLSGSGAKDGPLPFHKHVHAVCSALRWRTQQLQKKEQRFQRST
jgi:hypothetical protein